MNISLSKEPLRLILGGILLVLGVLALIGFTAIPFAGTIFAVAGVITGVLLVFRTKYL
jgi:hypothetical protein